MGDDLPAEPEGWSETEVYECELDPEHVEQLSETGELVVQWEGVGEPPPGLDEYAVEVRLTLPERNDTSDFRVEDVVK